jgi:uncharacterized protein (TIGR01777 family)
MRIVVAGGTGFLGKPLCERLVARGDEVLVLSRGAAVADAAWTGTPSVRTVRWTAGESPHETLRAVAGSDVVINLAGESIAGRRWSSEQKARLERSRLDATRALVAAIGTASPPPRLLLNGSAIGYYGSRGDEELTEASRPGTDFLARLATRWETEAMRAASITTAVALVRTGIVLARGGGALEQMVPPFRIGVGGPMGPGDQYMSWIHLEDWMALVLWMTTSEIEGPVNAVAPAPVTNAVFAATLGKVLKRPAVLRAPAFALRLLLGEMAEPLLLFSQRVVPTRALESGFVFRYARLEEALADLLGA